MRGSRNECSSEPESAFNQNRNECSSGSGFAVQAKPDWVFKLSRNTQRDGFYHSMAFINHMDVNLHNDFSFKLIQYFQVNRNQLHTAFLIFADGYQFLDIRLNSLMTQYPCKIYFKII